MFGDSGNTSAKLQICQPDLKARGGVQQTSYVCIVLSTRGETALQISDIPQHFISDSREEQNCTVPVNQAKALLRYSRVWSEGRSLYQEFFFLIKTKRKRELE